MSSEYRNEIILENEIYDSFNLLLSDYIKKEKKMFYTKNENYFNNILNLNQVIEELKNLKI